jgi:trigger factor
MTSSVETLSGLDRRLTFTVNSAEIGAQVKARLQELAKTVRMAGFRKGKVPLSMVERNYGFQVQNEALSDAVSKAFSQAVTDSKLRIAGEPKLDRSDAPAEDGQMSFTATFEVYPDFSLKDLSSLEAERFTAQVRDEDVEKTVTILRKQRATFADAARPAQNGDRVTIDFKGTLNAEAFTGGSAEDFPFTPGEGRMLPDFEKGVIGMVASEQKTFDVAFPEDYGNKDLAGKTAQFAVTAKKVEMPVLPEVDADFAKALGVPDGDVTKLRDDIRKNLEREVAQRLRGRTKLSVMDALPGLAEFDLPKSLVEQEQARLAEQAKAELAQRGVDVKNIPVPVDAFTEQAQKRVRLGLIVGELVKQHNLQAKPDQIKKQIEEFAQSYENPGEVVRWYFSDKQRLSEVEGMVLEQNVVDMVLAQGKISEKALAFDELMANT